jgi:hypothetical protein
MTRREQRYDDAVDHVGMPEESTPEFRANGSDPGSQLSSRLYVFGHSSFLIR